MANPPGLPLRGRAAYEGAIGGRVRCRSADNWGKALTGTLALEEFDAVTLRADFAANTLSGCAGCGSVSVPHRSHLRQFLGDEAQTLHALPRDYEPHLGGAFKPDDGTLQSPDVTVTHPERTVTDAEGFRGGQFSNLPDAAGQPSWWRASATPCSRRPTPVAACSWVSSMP